MHVDDHYPKTHCLFKDLVPCAGSLKVCINGPGHMTKMTAMSILKIIISTLINYIKGKMELHMVLCRITDVKRISLYIMLGDHIFWPVCDHFAPSY